MGNKEKFLVIDTNIVLLNSENLLNLAKDRIVVLPETVIYEVDSFKGSFGELGFHAREFSRIVSKMETISIDESEDKNIVKINLKYNDYQYMFVSKKKYNVSKDEESYNDKKIVEIAETLKDDGHDVTFMSSDHNCRFSALVKGIHVEELRLVEEVDTNFIKYLEIEDDEVFRMLGSKSITEVDKDWDPKYHNYKFYHTRTGNEVLAIIVNGYINPISKQDANELRSPKNQPIAPMNCEQLLMSRAIQDSRIDVIVCEAKAGSGKTLTAVSNAMRLIDLNQYSGITYIRNPINDEEQGEDIGYLAGNEEKMSMYLGPIHDQVDCIARKMLKGTKNRGKAYEESVETKIMELNSKYDIQSMITTGTRGMTFKDRVIILDEWQNASDATAQKILTRIGENCKVIIIGSNRQIDNKYLTRFNNGLSTLMDACTKEQSGDVTVYAIKLGKVLRSPIANWSENLFSKKHKKQ